MNWPMVRPPPKVEQVLLPLVAHAETPGGSVCTVVARTERIFRPTRLVIEPSCAEAFDVWLVVGNWQYFNEGTEHGVPATLFPPLPLCVPHAELARYEALLAVTFTTAQAGFGVTLHGKNRRAPGRPPVRLAGALWGLTVDRDY